MTLNKAESVARVSLGTLSEDCDEVCQCLGQNEATLVADKTEVFLCKTTFKSENYIGVNLIRI